jgi:hypothetical protein
MVGLEPIDDPTLVGLAMVGRAREREDHSVRVMPGMERAPLVRSLLSL